MMDFIIYMAIVALMTTKSIHQINAYDQEKHLLETLLTNYSYHVRPVYPDQIPKPTEVAVSMRLLQIFELEEKSQILAASVFFLQKWKDHRLSWNLTKFGNVKTLLLSPTKIWTPDVVIMNNAVSEYSGREVGMSAPVHVSHDGEIYWYSNVLIKSYCKMKVKYFPFDQQFCPIKLSSWSYNETEVILKYAESNSESILLNYTENSAWTLDKMHCQRKTTNLAFLNPRIPKTMLNYIIQLRRKAFYYFVYLFSPCLLSSILMIIIFVLPPECGERMVVGITLMLALTVFFLLAAKNIPETSEDIPLMGRYYSLTLVEMAIALFCTSIVLRFHHSSSKIPNWMKVYILRRLAYLVRIRTPQNSKANMKSDKDEDSCQNKLAGHSVPFHGEDSGLVLMAEQLIEDAENEAMCDEWKLAAKVLNRFFLLLYVTATLLSVIGVFIQSPGLIIDKQSSVPDYAI